MAREFLGLVEVSQVLVVSEQGNRMNGPLQVVMPMFESMDDSKQLSIVDVIVVLSRRERL